MRVICMQPHVTRILLGVSGWVDEATRAQGAWDCAVEEMYVLWAGWMNGEGELSAVQMGNIGNETHMRGVCGIL